MMGGVTKGEGRNKELQESFSFQRVEGTLRVKVLPVCFLRQDPDLI